MSDREAFEKWARENKLDLQHIGVCYGDDCTQAAFEAWQAAQAQASKPIAAVHGWFHGECVLRPLDPEAVLPAGMALYSQPQAQAGDGEAVGVIDYAFMAGVALTEEGASLPHGTKLYTAPPAAAVNQQLLEALSHGFINVVYTYGLNAAGEPYQEYKKLVDDAEAFLTAQKTGQAAKAGEGEAAPPCDCIEKVGGFFVSNCYCRNIGDARDAQTYCVENNTAPPASVNQQLLEALKALYDYNPHNCPSCEPTNEELELWEKARAAIAAAQEQSK